MAADGMSYGTRITHFNTSKAAASVVDALLDSTTYASRMLGLAKPFDKATLKKTVKVTERTQGQWITGAEALNSAAENVTIQLEFNQTAYTSPVVDILVEAMARDADQDIDYEAFNYEDSLDEVVQDLSDAAFGVGAGDSMLGLEAIVDDGTNASTIGGQSRTTYDELDSTVTASGGTISLSKIGTLLSTVGDTGANERPTIFLTTDTIFNLYETLLNPTVTHEYSYVPVRGRMMKATEAAMGAGMGWNTLAYRGVPILTDKKCPSGVFYALNENYLNFFGKSKAPGKFAKYLQKVNLGKSVKEGAPGDRPSEYNGFFYQTEQMLPNQGASVGRFWVFGQLVSFNPRRHGKLTGITSV